MCAENSKFNPLFRVCCLTKLYEFCLKMMLCFTFQVFFKGLNQEESMWYHSWALWYHKWPPEQFSFLKSGVSRGFLVDKLDIHRKHLWNELSIVWDLHSPNRMIPWQLQDPGSRFCVLSLCLDSSNKEQTIHSDVRAIWVLLAEVCSAHCRHFIHVPARTEASAAKHCCGVIHLNLPLHEPSKIIIWLKDFITHLHL